MRRAAADRKRELIAGLASARSRLLEAVASLPEERLGEIFLGTWSVQDLLAHLAGWDHTNLQAVQEILAGQAPSFLLNYDPDWRSYNARLVEIYKLEPFSALLSAVQESHRRLVAFLESLPPGDLVYGKARRQGGRTVTIRNLLLAETSDEGTHLEQVRQYSEAFKPEQS